MNFYKPGHIKFLDENVNYETVYKIRSISLNEIFFIERGWKDTLKNVNLVIIFTFFSSYVDSVNILWTWIILNYTLEKNPLKLFCSWENCTLKKEPYFLFPDRVFKNYITT